MLPILNTPALDLQDATRRAELCMNAWRKELSNRLGSMIGMLPECLLPSALLEPWFAPDVIEKINRQVTATRLAPNARPGDVKSELSHATRSSEDALKTFLDVPADNQRQKAFRALFLLRNLVHSLPRSILLP
jgi:hypothetical protein